MALQTYVIGSMGRAYSSAEGVDPMDITSASSVLALLDDAFPSRSLATFHAYAVRIANLDGSQDRASNKVPSRLALLLQNTDQGDF